MIEPGRPPSVLVDDDQSDVSVDAEALRDAAVRALALLGVSPEASLSIHLVGGPRIAELKQQAFGVRRETDVLSFPMDDPADPMPGPVVLGDVVICPAVAHRQARALGIRFEDEMRHLLVHGVLHVLGRDHANAQDELAMAAEERDLIARLDSVRA